MRWFVEEVGDHIVLSRIDEDPEAFVADFTWDRGATWVDGDRSLGYRVQGSLGVEEITEERALQLLTAGVPPGEQGPVDE